MYAMIFAIYRSLWLLLNLLASGWDAIYALCLCMQAYYRWSYDRLIIRKSRVELDLLLLERCKKNLNKVPHHLNVIIGPAQKNTGLQLERIILYALFMDIKCISICDTRPASQSRKKRMYLRGIDLLTGLEPPRVMRKVLHKTMKIEVLEPNDGRSHFVFVCRELHRDRHSLKEIISDRESLINHIDSIFHQKLQLIEPELSIIFNRTTTTFGLLPWQTSFTEFQTIESMRYFNAEQFAKVLYRYARCEQRWGK